ncbi:hypothetical protein DMC47_04410 [Nostoc sp. 3335mG]|nr:hypothetical protein DMC47_04410 [Nostoc sp. 3335mG]
MARKIGPNYPPNERERPDHICNALSRYCEYIPRSRDKFRATRLTFTRTSSGIANEAIFLGVRFIVYVEEDQNLETSRSVDVAFWASFFRHKFPNQTVQFKGLGGKKHVLEYAKKIIDNSIPNSLCALDTDYDNLFSEQIADERVFYTHGYGAENDAFNRKTVPILAESLLPAHLDDDFGEGVWRNVCDTLSLERISLLSDQICATRRGSSLNRANPISVLDQNRQGLPIRFRRSAIKQELRTFSNKGTVRVPTQRLRSFPERVPAHLYFEIVYLTLIRAVRNLSTIRYDKDWIRNLCLSLFRRAWDVFLDDSAAAHYQILASRDLSKFSSLPRPAS